MDAVLTIICTKLKQISASADVESRRPNCNVSLSLSLFLSTYLRGSKHLDNNCAFYFAFHLSFSFGLFLNLNSKPQSDCMIRILILVSLSLISLATTQNISEKAQNSFQVLSSFSLPLFLFSLSASSRATTAITIIIILIIQTIAINQPPNSFFI